jgi:hypothetical protein
MSLRRMRKQPLKTSLVDAQVGGGCGRGGADLERAQTSSARVSAARSIRQRFSAAFGTKPRMLSRKGGNTWGRLVALSALTR